MQTGAAKGFGGIIVLHIFLNSKNSVGSVGSASSFCLLSAEIFLFFFCPVFPARLSWESNFCVRPKVFVVAGRQALRPFYCLCRNATIA